MEGSVAGGEGCDGFHKEFEEELLEVSCRGQEFGQVSLLRLE